MKKLTWHSDLVNYLRDNQTTPFEWGRFDCCLFACNCVEVMTGIDPGKQYRNRYTTAIGAKRALTKYADGTIKGAFTAVFGQIKPRLNAGRGDIVLVRQGNDELIGVLCGGNVWACGETGVLQLPFSQVLGCWKVDEMKVNESGAPDV